MVNSYTPPRVSLLVTDLDNTLWDWFDAWHASFSAMLRRLSELSGVPQHQLEQEIQTVHRRRGTSEYSYLLNELPSLLEKSPHSNPSDIYDDAIHVLNRARLHRTALYPGVEETLRELQRRNIPVVAYTESVSYWSEWRIKRTRLDGLIQVMYSSPDHDFPLGISVDTLRTQPPSAYGLRRTVHKHVPPGTLKPDTNVLRSILADFSMSPQKAVYVGDSLMKDVLMAQELGVHDAYAKYGVSHDREGYDLLRRVSHWTQEDIQREKALAARPSITPSHVLSEGFSQLLTMFDFKET
ncbi:HAD family hydrolase [Streptomyces phaeochromogenes]|uniref:HAD family hydrolase n=1 Tax=Streptomyces phaeochromogenes TaxID=1923 RepID=UPI0038675004|nr:HAD family hydrolase [Streptomyces phaeochromogenes]